MAKGKKTGGRDFKKGQVPKSPGRPPLTDEQKQLRKLTTAEFIERINKYLYLTKDKLKEGINQGNIEVLDLCIRNALIKCIEKGDYYMFDKMMERLMGRPRDIPDDADAQRKELVEAMRNAAEKDLQS